MDAEAPLELSNRPVKASPNPNASLSLSFPAGGDAPKHAEENEEDSQARQARNAAPKPVWLRQISQPRAGPARH